jgi:glycogen synthase
MDNKITAVHVTHETVGKVGGIGAVLNGLFTCDSYLERVNRSILVGPLFETHSSLSNRLGEDGQVLYSSLDGFADTVYAHDFQKIEDYYNTSIVYGRRTFIDGQTGVKSEPEVLLIDVTRMKKAPIEEFKWRLFERFGIRSDLYEHLWDYEQYVRLAPAAMAALKVIGAAKDSTVVIAHEFMGMPTALAAILEGNCSFRTAFYAHEVATIRRIVEEHPGHDVMFYNVVRRARESKQCVDEVFGDQSSYFKHPLVQASRYCDNIYAVGDYVADELRFLAPEFETVKISVVYNGIPACKISVADKIRSKEKLQLYCENLLGYRPDFVFTHVTRLVRSKGLWRDLQVLEHLEKDFRAENKTAVLFLLSTEVSQRPTEDILNMESAYNWPVAHRQGWPDMSGGEANFYTFVQQFNARSRNIKVIFINQFGFEPKHCGKRMPVDMGFMDIRKGTDVEFGQSIYEPFGISQLEPLTFGGICVISNVCGCAGFLRKIKVAEAAKNVIVADYINLGYHSCADIQELLRISEDERNCMETLQSEKVAKQIIEYLPRNESELKSMIETGYQLARNMSWDVVVENYLLSGLGEAAGSLVGSPRCD